MGKRKRSQFYAVAKGRNRGIYKTWDECKVQVNGFQGARYKGFQTRDEAQAFIDYGYKMINNGKPTESSRRATAIQALAKQQPEEPEQRIVMTGLAIVEEDSDDLPKLKQTKLTGTSSRGSVTDLRLTVSFDGGSRGNPGVAGAGASVISFDGSNRRTINIRKYVGDQETNNFAEYWGVVIGLRTALREVEHLKASWTQRRDPCVNLIVQGDSKLVINQLLGVWKVKKPKLQPLWRKARQQQLEIERITQCITSLEHVYREFNSVADGLANAAMDSKRSWMTTSDDNHEQQLDIDELLRGL